MKKTLIVLLTAAAGVTTVGLMAGEDRDSKERHHEPHHDQNADGAPRGLLERLFRDDDEAWPEQAWLTDDRRALYQSECGDCHIAYPPGMLPAVSWQATIASLDDHFGENAELDLETRVRIQDYLGDHAAAPGNGDYAERMWRATRGMAAPLRITETDYFVGQHHEIPLNMVTGNPEVRSFSRCDACHAGAADGDFDEHDIRIARHGKWDD